MNFLILIKIKFEDKNDKKHCLKYQIQIPCYFLYNLNYFI
jgi:hypothetical protein